MSVKYVVIEFCIRPTTTTNTTPVAKMFLKGAKNELLIKIKNFQEYLAWPRILYSAELVGGYITSGKEWSKLALPLLITNELSLMSGALVPAYGTKW